MSEAFLKPTRREGHNPFWGKRSILLPLGYGKGFGYEARIVFRKSVIGRWHATACRYELRTHNRFTEPSDHFTPNVLKTLAQTWHVRTEFYSSRSLSVKGTMACPDHIAPGRA